MIKSLRVFHAIGVLVTLCILHAPIPSSAQALPPKIEWQRSLGGRSDDAATIVEQTADGGFVVGGWYWSDNGDLRSNHPGTIRIVKLTPLGTVQWFKAIGGGTHEEVNSIQQVRDGGYIVAGSSSGTGGDVTEHHGISDSSDCWIVKLDSVGQIEWQHSFGGSGDDVANAVEQTTDGGYIFAGSSHSNNGDVTGHHGRTNNADDWVVKLTNLGVIQWQKSLGGTGPDEARSVHQTSDGGYIVAGYSLSTDGDVTGNHGGTDYWAVKLSDSGSIEWQRSLGGSGYEDACAIQQTTDGGYVVAGTTDSTDGDVTGTHGDKDYWVVKLSSGGAIEWERAYGGSSADVAYSIKQTTDGGYVVAGMSVSTDGDAALRQNGGNLVIKLTPNGQIEWAGSLGSGVDARSIDQTRDGGYVLTGILTGAFADTLAHHGGWDMWVAKAARASSDVRPQPLSTEPVLAVVPNPALGTAVLTFENTTDAEYSIEIISATGSVVKRQRAHLVIGRQEIELDTSSLTAGIYDVIAFRANAPASRTRLVLLDK